MLMTAKEIDDLLDSLNIEKIVENTYMAHQAPTCAPRTFGGQFLAHAIMVCGRSLPNPLAVHSVSAHFVRGGNPHEPIVYEVTTLREHKKYANKLVTGYQDSVPLFTALLAFTDNYTENVQHNVPMPDVPMPHDLPDLSYWLSGYEEQLPHFVNEPKRMDWRYVNEPSWVQRTKDEYIDYNQVWVKPSGIIPDDPLIHSAVFAFCSDTTILDSVLSRNHMCWGFDRVITFTVNHSLWFHEPINFNQFLLYSTSSSIANGGRAISSGHLFDPETRRAVVSVTQECAVKSVKNRR